LTSECEQGSREKIIKFFIVNLEFKQTITFYLNLYNNVLSQVA